MVKILVISFVFSTLIDFYSCYIFLRRNRKKFGTLGLPVVTLIIFCLLPLLISKQAVITYSVVSDCLILTTMHLIIVYLIPIIDRKIVEKFRR